MSTSIRRSCLPLSAVLVATLLAGCGGAGPTPAPTAGAPTEVPATLSTPAPTPSPAPTPTPVPTAVASPMAFASGVLPAGTYITTGTPAVAFTVDAGWTATHPDKDPNLFDLEKGSTYLFVGSVSQIFNSDQMDTIQVPENADPAAMAAEMAKVSELHVSDPKPIAIGGATGVSFDVTTDAQLITGLVAGDHTGFTFAEKQTDRLAFLSVAGRLVVVAVEGATNQFDSVAAQAQPVLDSIRFQ
jgi:hypothetical protein